MPPKTSCGVCGLPVEGGGVQVCPSGKCAHIRTHKACANDLKSEKCPFCGDPLPNRILQILPKRRKDFVRVILDNYRTTGTLMPPEKLVRVTKRYFKTLYQEHQRQGRKRESSYLSSTQTALSRIKTTLRGMGVAEGELQKIRLAADDTRELLQSKSRRVHERGVNLPQVPADSIILDCRDIIRSSESPKYFKVIALAALTGRRLVEIMYTIKLNAPKLKHKTHSKYWCCFKGMAKQRGFDACIECPLLACRSDIQKCLKDVRSSFEAPPKQLSEAEKRAWINDKHGKPVSRCMRKYCSQVGKLHNFRKFYAATAYRYHNDTDASLSRFASDVLGHRQTSSSVLTYMNFRISDIGKITFQE